MIQQLGVLVVILPVFAVASKAQQGTATQKAAHQRQLAAKLKSDPVAPLRMANLSGKYRMLLRQIKVNEPGKDLIVDRGFGKKRTYKGHKNLPAGHWVYVRPYWFIWRDTGAARLPKRRWGPEQMIGRPDARPGSDAPAAWASKAQNRAATEWVILEFC